jgi:hypothetical protein
LTLFAKFAFAGFRYFGFDPWTLHTVRGKDEEELVVVADGFVNLVMDFFAGNHVVGGEPATDAGDLEIGIQAVGKGLVLGGVRDEAGVEFDGLIEVFDEIFGEAVARRKLTGSRPFLSMVAMSRMLGPTCPHVSSPIVFAR